MQTAVLLLSLWLMISSNIGLSLQKRFQKGYARGRQNNEPLPLKAKIYCLLIFLFLLKALRICKQCSILSIFMNFLIRRIPIGHHRDAITNSILPRILDDRLNLSSNKSRGSEKVKFLSQTHPESHFSFYKYKSPHPTLSLNSSRVYLKINIFNKL